MGVKCDFCGKKIYAKIILRDTQIFKKNGSDIVLCNNCLNYYTSGQYNKIKLKKK